MKLRLMAATAALALMTGAAAAQDMSAEQETAVRSEVLKATVGGGGEGSDRIPTAETEGWEVGATVPNSYESAPVRDVEGMDGYSYVVTDDDRAYLMDSERKIVSEMSLLEASNQGSEGIPAPGDPRKDVAQPTQK